MIKVEIKGLGELIGQLNILDKNAVANTHEAIEESAQRVKDDAKASAPKGETGKLKHDIRVIKDKDKLSAKVTYMGKGKAYWGKFIEFGTKLRPAKPFLGPAWEREKDRFIENVKKGLDEA